MRSFLEGMKSLFEEHYVSIPEDKYDVLESMVEKLDDMETKLNEQIEKNISLNSRLAESVAGGILDQVSPPSGVSDSALWSRVAGSWNLVWPEVGIFGIFVVVAICESQV